MDLGYKDKVCVVAGGSTGIGLETALTFAREGAKVALFSRTGGKVKAAAEEFEKEGLEVYTAVIDASDKAEVTSFADAVAQRWGGIDVWVNCAGGNRRNALDDTTEEDYQYILDLNIKSVFVCANVASEHLKRRGGGAIINIGSLAGICPVAGKGLYAMCKAAVHTLTTALAAELAAWNIRVLAVAPGLIDTALTRYFLPSTEEELAGYYSGTLIRKIGQPSDVANPIVYLASDKNPFMTGITIEVTGGFDLVNTSSYSYDLKKAREDGTYKRFEYK